MTNWIRHNPRRALVWAITLALWAICLLLAWGDLVEWMR